jgi:FtsH-binding integral membrane protein
MPNNFIPLVYLHLLGGTGLTFLSSTHPLSTSLVYRITVSILPLLLIFVLFVLSNGVFKYAVAALFCVLLGQTLSVLVDRLQQKELLPQVLASVLGIFTAMTAVGFYDKQNLLGFGGYLLAALVGVVLGQLGLLAASGFTVSEKTLLNVQSGISIFATTLFSVYVAYDTQRLKRDAKSKTKPDYIDASLGLYLDFINLFANMGRLMDD